MSEEKRTTATVKANFNAKAAQEAVNAEAEKKTARKAAAKKSASGKTAETKKQTKTVTAAENDVQAAEQKEGTKVEKKVAKTTAAKTTAAKTTTKKTATKKTAAVAKKTTAPEAEVILQWNGQDYSTARLIQSAKDVWQYDLGKNVADFKSAKIYVKPEESKAYVVVNDTEKLSFDI